MRPVTIGGLIVGTGLFSVALAVLLAGRLAREEWG